MSNMFLLLGPFNTWSLEAGDGLGINDYTSCHSEYYPPTFYLVILSSTREIVLDSQLIFKHVFKYSAGREDELGAMREGGKEVQSDFLK